MPRALSRLAKTIFLLLIINAALLPRVHSQAIVGGGIYTPLDGTIVIGTASSATTFTNYPIDTAGYPSILIAPNVGNANTVAIQGSNDYNPTGSPGNGKWVGLSCLYPDAPGDIITSTILQADAWCANTYRYVRAIIVTYVTGTTTLTAALRTNPAPATTAIVIGANAGTSAALQPSVCISQSTCEPKTSAGNIYSMTGNSGVSPGYIMLLDQTATPTNGSVTPVVPLGSGSLMNCFAVPANTPFSLNWNPGPVSLFVHALWIVGSSTGCDTLTLQPFVSVTAFVR